MKNFIPKAFPEEEDSCPVCLAKASMEAAFHKEATAIQNLLSKACSGHSTFSADAQTLLDLMQKFFEMHSDFRVSLAINLGIWFSAERYGRAKKVVELLMACDEYRDRAVQSLEALDTAIETFSGQLTDAQKIEYRDLFTVHKEALETARSFWAEIDKWNNRRRDEAFSVI